MAFISEINFSGGDGVAGGEFIEIALGPNDDPADFVVSVYRDDGTLHTGAGISGGEVTLSSLTGVPDPDNSDFTIYVIPVGIRNAASNTDEGSAIALTDTSSGGGVIDFYSAAALSSITATGGAADNATSAPTFNHKALDSGDSYHWDIFGNDSFSAIDGGDAVLCLTGSCDVKTAKGPVKAQDLQVGDLVWTLDHGYQPVRWMGQTQVTAQTFAQTPNACPVRIARGALAPNVPETDILLSPQHRVLLRSKAAERMYGTSEVLAAAKKLVGFDGITVEQSPSDLFYIHVLFDAHEVLDVSGALTESLFMGAVSQKRVQQLHMVDEFGDVLPVAASGKAEEPARVFVEGPRGKNFLRRMQQNGRVLQSKDMGQDNRDMSKAEEKSQRLVG